MDYIIIGLLVLLVILVIISMFKGNKNDRLTGLELSITKDISSLKESLSKDFENQKALFQGLIGGPK